MLFVLWSSCFRETVTNSKLAMITDSRFILSLTHSFNSAYMQFDKPSNRGLMLANIHSYIYLSGKTTRGHEVLSLVSYGGVGYVDTHLNTHTKLKAWSHHTHRAYRTHPYRIPIKKKHANAPQIQCATKGGLNRFKVILSHTLKIISRVWLKRKSPSLW